MEKKSRWTTGKIVAIVLAIVAAATAFMIAVVVLISILFAGGLFFGITETMRNTPAYQAAIEYIEDNQRIAELVGEIESYGRFLTGSVNASAGGRGDASFTIHVNGTEGIVRVNVRLEREPLRDWEVVDFYYRTD